MAPARRRSRRCRRSTARPGQSRRPHACIRARPWAAGPRSWPRTPGWHPAGATKRSPPRGRLRHRGGAAWGKGRPRFGKQARGNDGPRRFRGWRALQKMRASARWLRDQRHPGMARSTLDHQRSCGCHTCINTTKILETCVIFKANHAAVARGAMRGAGSGVTQRVLKGRTQGRSGTRTRCRRARRRCMPRPRPPPGAPRGFPSAAPSLQ